MPTAHNKQNYLNYKSKHNYTTRKLKRGHIESLLNKYRSKLSKLWGIMKDIINRNKMSITHPEYFYINGKKVTNKNDIANHFNEYYINIRPNLCKTLPKNNESPLTYMNMRTQDSMFLYPTNEEEVTKIIANIRVSSPGWDEISANVIINAADILSKPLTFLYNLSLQSGIFPSELKLAKVIPIHKGDSKHLLNDYRPVSVLPVLSKILEKIVYSRLIAFINKHNILYNLQFGFREGHSTSMALMVLVDKIFWAIDDDEYVLGVFLDFGNAFDCLDHGILLKKNWKFMG